MPVKVRLDTRRGFVQRVDVPSPDESAEFERSRTFLEKPDRIRKIDVSSIDPTTFNIVDHYLNFPTFKLCKKIVPNYKGAKKIFDFCAQQSCHLPGPYDISPCIPFQYVRDGCYARAHKMRWIITNKYRYCCEKVFSFANQNDDVLAVTADKWGGCCVMWWYHVAPLIRVRIKLPKISKKSLTFALVIDPSMFDKPVLLSSWLTAQEKTACDSRANVSMYSIQPGSAYSPANYQGSAFTTDPAYTATDGTLVGYSSLVTCT
ncbi:MAG: protein-glutamine glutaminase family protein [Planctomycetota bacterium]